jgi:hypothetical protein
MEEGSRSVVVLAVLVWGTLAGLADVFLRMAMRPDAGYGAAGRERNRHRRPTRDGVTPVVIPPRQVSLHSAHR